MKNEYEIRGDVTAIFLDSEKYGRMETIISTTDLPRAQEFSGKWYPNWNSGTRSFYVIGKFRRQDGTYTAVKLHRWVLKVDDPKTYVDHVFHDTLDNCRWALNIVSQRENSQNNRINRRNKSGFSGISWNARLGKWKAHIRVKYELIHLGYYVTKDEAITARKSAEARYYDYKSKIN